MNLAKLLENSCSYSDLCSTIRRNGGLVLDADNDITIIYWPRSQQNQLHPLWINIPVTSIIINRANLTLITLGAPYVFFNDYCAITEACIRQETMTCVELYDAREVMMFFYGSRWYMISEDNLSLSVIIPWQNKDRTIQDLWNDCTKMKLEDFFDKHDKSTIYYYQLLHYDDRHVIDYSEQFGSFYKKLILTATKPFGSHDFTYHANLPLRGDFIMSVPIHKDFSILDTRNEEDEDVLCLLDIKRAGIRVYTESGHIVDLHTCSYKLYMETSDVSTSPCGSQHYIGLYQSNCMDTYLSRFKGETYHIGDDESSYQIKGLIDSVFKVLTSEILYIFKVLWDVRFGSAKEEYKDVYMSLPSEYKKVFYILRGIYFSKKLSNPTNKYVTVKTVYEMLKKMEPLSIVYLVKERQKLLSLTSTNKRLYQIFDEYNKTTHMERTAKVVNQAMNFIADRPV